MYSLLHRTGVRRGRVYNLTGDNITEAAAGAGNLMVGPWGLDYSSFIAGGPAEGILFDSEFSGVLLDGRALRSSSAEEPFLFADLDEDEGLADSGSMVKQGDNSVTMHGCAVRLYHTSCTWEDARVWNLQQDGTFEANDHHHLDTYLDNLDNVEDGLWHPVRHALRIPVNWAIYNIPLTPRYTGLVEMIALNTATTVSDADMLSYGPLGMLTAMHGAVYAATHATRLYEANAADFRPVARGMYIMPYDSAHDDSVYDPDTKLGFLNQPDEWVDAGIVPETFQATSVDAMEAGVSTLDTPAQRARGRLYTKVLATGRDIRASPKRITVWHLQTVPVRVNTFAPVGGGDAVNVIIGGLTSPFEGPPIRLVYHECTTRFRAR